MFDVVVNICDLGVVMIEKETSVHILQILEQINKL